MGLVSAVAARRADSPAPANTAHHIKDANFKRPP
jgi:hypothetical protein